MIAPLVVVLVEPEGALNVGSVARLCANFPVEQLRLVAPRCDPDGPEARRMAVHGQEVLRQARIDPGLRQALADCHRVVACSARLEPEPVPALSVPEALDWLQSAAEGERAAVVFGRESRGLSNEELLQANRLLRIDTGSPYGSLNLSHAVAVVLHSWMERQRRPGASGSGPGHGALAADGAAATREDLPPNGVLDACLEDAEQLLLNAGFLLPHTARARMAKLRALLNRADITDSEVALLRGMVRQLRWASRHPHA
ncbi:RNA methyltransferase [Synechococcus sp. RSCCF101]|uniref:RNA methyltransferase n=1 Tax=Synechococcus sp. RSCCF101 TaxID=2511069 RepID=UPI0012452D81|nr:RNA methyltransferase [Synechococcus sp. RSCCF101]QEY30981.1 RNA methyltransferase [Synechococcus sp. RSCCF101]